MKDKYRVKDGKALVGKLYGISYHLECEAHRGRPTAASVVALSFTGEAVRDLAQALFERIMRSIAMDAELGIDEGARSFEVVLYGHEITVAVTAANAVGKSLEEIV